MLRTHVFSRDRRGVVVVEFACAAPVLVLLLAAIANYSLLVWSRAQLASSIAQGAQFAYDTGRTVTATQITQVVQSASALNGVAATVTGPACYCLASGPTLSATSCTAACPDGTNHNYFVSITASYPYSSILPNAGVPVPTQLTDAATVRLQ